MKFQTAAAAIGALAVASSASALAPVNRAEKAVPSQYIVVFKKGVDASPHKAAIQSMLRARSDAEILHEYNIEEFQGYAIRCTEEVLAFIREAENIVEYVEEDQYMSIHASQSNPPSWGLRRTSQRSNNSGDNVYRYPTSAGQGVDMYTIDTGIYVGHNDYSGRVRWGYNAVAGSTNDDLNGHGTHCSGTMGGTSYGIAKKANLIAVKVLGDNGSGSTAGVIAGVDWVANQHSGSKKSVANMSLGGGASTALDNAVASCVSRGVHVAVAAGNDNRDACNYSPARVASAVTVGATDSADRKSSFSNYGSCVDINAPGTSITSAWIGGSSASRSISGTSMAAPHVAGVMALYLSQGKTPSKANLQNDSTKNAITGLPSGTVNYLLYSSDALSVEDGDMMKIPEIHF